MPEGKGPRVVQALNSKGRIAIGFIYSDSTSQGPELVVMEVDAQSDTVSFDHKKGTYGKDFVEQGEDTSHLGDAEREAFTHKTEEPFVGVTEPLTLEGRPINEVREYSPADKDKSGDISPKEAKRYKKDHPNG